MEFPQLFDSETIDANLEKLRNQRANPPAHERSAPETLISSLAVIGTNYPRIYDQITSMWGTHELDKWFSDLIMGSEREDGELRVGFPPKIMAHLLVVYNIHAKYLKKEINVDWKLK